ncbi:MAG: helix-turn-helix domain-containing protein [ANME-2 cluster archaeon]|nr:helix-turn-helix domain-containing protein [ANME-2 cluster archaeon]
MRETVLRITMPDNWVKDVSKKYSANIKFIECMPYGESGGRGLIEIEGDEDVIHSITADIKAHPDVKKVDISGYKSGGVYGSVVTNKCSACRALATSDCFLISAHCLGDGRVEWRLITGGEGSLQHLRKCLEERGCEVELENSSVLTKKNILTSRQEEIVRIALTKGYYDYPKKTTIKELATMFNASPSTIGEIVQRGEKKIMKEHFQIRI